MIDIEIGSVWVGKTNDKIIATVTRLMPEKEALQYRTSTGWTTSSIAWFLEDFKLMGEVADMVNHPPHYKDESGIECIEVTKYMSFLGGNCFKYLYRAGKKGSTIEDLKKAAWYADRAWENEEVVLIAPMRLIEKIAVHREGNIKQAMLYVAEDFWAMAERVIEAEIARLESE
tara:strand:- start:200 stop:718 length:519 start_codon:yes stop_codon:yes gene_type:complete